MNTDKKIVKQKSIKVKITGNMTMRGNEDLNVVEKRKHNKKL
jgi:hypothetical protein